MIDQARQFLPVAESECAPVQAMRSDAWLSALWDITAHEKLDADSQDQKLDILNAMIAEYPGVIFTRDSLTRAARQFKFWPAFMELSEFLDNEAYPVRARRDRLYALANSQPCEPQVDNWPPKRTKEDIQAVEEIMKKWRSSRADETSLAHAREGEGKP